MTESGKTSDQIINELYESLNIQVDVAISEKLETSVSEKNHDDSDGNCSAQKNKSKKHSKKKKKKQKKSKHHNNVEEIHCPPANITECEPQKVHCKVDNKSRSRSPMYREKESRGRLRSHSRSPSYHRRRPRSYSTSRHDSRSGTRSKRKSSPLVTSSKDNGSLDPLDAWKSAKLASLRKQIKSTESTNGATTLPVDTIPLPAIVVKSNKKPNHIARPGPCICIDLTTIPVPHLTSKHASNMPAEKPKNNEGKAKVIIIKDLKDSLVCQQASLETHKNENNLTPVTPIETPPTQTPITLQLQSPVPDAPEVVSSDETPFESKDKKPKKHKKHKNDKKSRTKRSRSRSSERSSRRSSKRSRRSRSGDRSRSRRTYHTKSTRDKSRSSSATKNRQSLDGDKRLRDTTSRKKLLEIARKNAVYLMKNECLPPAVQKETVKITGKSVDELTDFCKKLVNKEDYSDADVSEAAATEDNEQPFASRHPFMVKDKPIMMNIRNAPMLPTKTNAERLADHSKLREQFPVSSGSQHRTKESGWVPVEKEEKAELVDKVFPEEVQQDLDITHLVTTRLNAMRKLATNPEDTDAITQLTYSQREMHDWAVSKQVPGHFTGSTGARILSIEQLSSGHQAWARKEQFKETTPVSPHFGLKMLQKMGWNPGEGLGKNKEGSLQPLLLDVKMDKKGLHSQEEVPSKRLPIPLAKNLAGKHPVSALVELCSKRKWSPPDFEIVFDCGPDHKKNFLMKAIVNGKEYKPSIATSTKKIAKANAAAACLQALGVIPKELPPTATSHLQTTTDPPGLNGLVVPPLVNPVGFHLPPPPPPPQVMPDQIPRPHGLPPPIRY